MYKGQTRKDLKYMEALRGAVIMTDAKKLEPTKAVLKKKASKGYVFQVPVMPLPSFPCPKPIAPFKARMGL